MDTPPNGINTKSLNGPLHLITFQEYSEADLDQLLEHFESIIKQRMYKGKKCFEENILRLHFNFNCDKQGEYKDKRNSARNFYRAAIIASDLEDACIQVNTKSYMKGSTSAKGSSKLCFLFTGQGSQYTGMAQVLYEKLPVYRVNFDKCNQLLLNRYGINVKNAICFESKGTLNSQTGQTSIFVVEYCLLKVWESWSVKPDAVIGHSLGEFVAAVAAGVLSFEDAIMLVVERARLIDTLPRGQMLALRADLEKTQQLLDNFSQKNSSVRLDIAAINSKHQTVLSGDSEYVEEFAKFCRNRKFKCILLETHHAFHSRHMDPILETYSDVVKTCNGDMIPSECVYISGVNGRVIQGPLNSTDYWVCHTRKPVQFLQASQVAYGEVRCNLFLEIGPHSILNALVKSNIGNVEEENQPLFLSSLQKHVDDMECMLNSLGKLWIFGRDVDWKAFHAPF